MSYEDCEIEHDDAYVSVIKHQMNDVLFMEVYGFIEDELETLQADLVENACSFGVDYATRDALSKIARRIQKLKTRCSGRSEG